MPTIIEEYYVEMAWDCKTCNTTNPGGSKTCSNCGKFLAKEEFHDKDARPTTILDKVKDEKLLTKAKGGPDWECRFCGSHQQRNSGECAVCGAGKQLSDEQSAVENITDSYVGIVPPEPSRELIKQRQVERKNRELRLQKIEQRKSVLSIGGGLLALVALISLIIWIFTPKYLDGKVSDVYFQHVAHVERNVVESDSGFSPDDGAFDIKEDGRKVHHTKKVQRGWDYPIVEKTITDPPHCYTTPIKKKDGDCVPQKNGFKKCKKITTGGDEVCEPRSHIEKKREKTPHYDDDPVYQTWYTWRIHKWVLNRSVPITGHTNEVSWPADRDIALNSNCGAGETERVKISASYSVTFTNKDDHWSYTPSGLPEYQALKLGSVHHLKIVVGMVTVLQ